MPTKRLPVLETDTLEALRKMIGSAKVDSLLGKFGEQLRGRLANEPNGAEDVATLAKEAHKLASSAGMLGFADLSRRCARLEATLKDPGDFATPIADVREACADALAEIARRLGARAPAATPA